VAGLTATYSGDLSSSIASALTGKVLNSAGMAKDESQRRKEEGLERAQPGSLFYSALQHELGGDLFNRTIGNFIPGKDIKQTDRTSTKEKRWKSQFPQKIVDKAEKELEKDDDSVPVKDEEVRNFATKLLGSHVEHKLHVIQYSVGELTNEVKSVNTSLVDTQKLLIDHNAILGTKFDQILEIFGKNSEFQDKIKDDAQVEASESELEKKKDLSGVTKLLSMVGGGSSSINGILGAVLRKGVSHLWRKYAHRGLRSRLRLGKQVFNRFRPRTIIKNIFNKQVLGSANNQVAKQVTQRAAQQIAKRQAVKQGGKIGAKFVSKKIPGVSLVAGSIFAIERAMKGDWTGAGLELLSGAAGTVPGWGTAASVGIDAALIGRDVAMPQHEEGTGLTEPGTAMLHGTELIITEKDRITASSEMMSIFDNTISHLVSSSLSLGTATGARREVEQEIRESGIDYTLVRLPYRTDLGRMGNINITTLEPPKELSTFFEKQKRDDQLSANTNPNNSTATPTPTATATPTPTPTSNYQPGANVPASGNNFTALDTGLHIGPPNDRDEEQTGLNMTLAGGLGVPIYAPIDLIYRLKGTDGLPAVGIDGNTNIKPSMMGQGFGYYGAYYFKKDGKEYEVLLGHFQSMAYKGQKDGDKIPKGTLLGHQGASGNTDSGTVGGPAVPHISLHVNGIGFVASNDVLNWFANGLAGYKPTTKITPAATSKAPGGGGNRKPPTRREEALLDTISFAEGTTGSYGTIFGGRVIPELSHGELTVKEVYDMMMTGSIRGRKAGYAKGSYATGRYQFMPDTILDIVNKYKALKWTDKFTPEAQDIAILSRIANFRGVTDSMLKSEGLSNKVLNMLSGEFASFPQYNGRSRYGQPVKSQDKLRQIYQKSINAIPTTQEGIQKQIKRNQWLRDNDPANFFGSNTTPGDNRVNSLYANSSMAEEVEEDSTIQQVYIFNTTVVASTNTSHITSIGSNNSLRDFNMAVLGA